MSDSMLRQIAQLNKLSRNGPDEVAPSQSPN